jgi:hypothetical protein
VGNHSHPDEIRPLNIFGQSPPPSPEAAREFRLSNGCVPIHIEEKR